MYGYLRLHPKSCRCLSFHDDIPWTDLCFLLFYSVTMVLFRFFYFRLVKFVNSFLLARLSNPANIFGYA